MQYNRALIALGSGAALTLAFAPFHWAWISFIAPAVLLGLILNRRQVPSVMPAKAGIQESCPLALDASLRWHDNFLLGFLFGLGFFGCSISWVYISIHTYGETPAFLAVILTALFVMLFALYMGLIGVATHYTLRNRPAFPLSFIVYPLAWVISEWLRSTVFTGFPWVFLGYAQLDTPLRGYIPLIGVYGATFVAVFCSVCVYWSCQSDNTSWRGRILLLCTLGALFGGGYLLNRIHWTKPIDRPISVSLIQANIGQSLKWDEGHFQTILDTYQHMTDEELGRDLIIWPEGAIPAPAYYVDDYLIALSKPLRANDSTVLLGTFLGENRQSLYNGILELGPAHTDMYLKRHLVPFGEFVPFTALLRGLIPFFNLPMSNLLEGPMTQPPFVIHDVAISSSICYEIGFPMLIWHHIAQTNLLLNISDDSWFAHSLAPAQQYQIAQIRALETGRPMLVSGNSGVTGYIDARGRSIAELPENEVGVLHVMAQGYTGTTPLIWLYSLLSGIGR